MEKLYNTNTVFTNTVFAFSYLSQTKDTFMIIPLIANILSSGAISNYDSGCQIDNVHIVDETYQCMKETTGYSMEEFYNLLLNAGKNCQIKTTTGYSRHSKNKNTNLNFTTNITFNNLYINEEAVICAFSRMTDISTWKCHAISITISLDIKTDIPNYCELAKIALLNKLKKNNLFNYRKIFENQYELLNNKNEVIIILTFIYYRSLKYNISLASLCVNYPYSNLSYEVSYDMELALLREYNNYDIDTFLHKIKNKEYLYLRTNIFYDENNDDKISLELYKYLGFKCIEV